MKKEHSAGLHSVQEIVFSLSMGIVAVLSRDNPMLIFPNVLWAFAAVFVFNLGYQVLLRRKSEFWLVPMVSVAVNTVLVSLVLGCSGRAESYFWPMYLLPIFTACFYLERRHAAFAVASSAAFLGCFYLDILDHGPTWQLLEWVVKAAVLCLAASVTWGTAHKERRARMALDSTRAELDRLARRLSHGEPAGLTGAKKRGVLVEAILYDLHSQLMSILGSAEVLSEQIPEGGARRDVERIGSSVRSMTRLVADILALLQPDSDSERVLLSEALGRSLEIVEFRLRHKGLMLSRESSAALPPLPVEGLQLRHVLLDLLIWVVDNAEDGGLLSILVAAGENGRGQELRVRFPAPAGAALPSCEELRQSFLPFRAEVDAKPGAGGVELMVRFSEPAAV
ncbi:MAG: hypothetical protein WCU88_05135 [Elusimicrobiota bacterium]|jgi:signal transduction histidine kinase